MRKLTFLMLFAVMGMVAEAQISRYIKVIGTGDSTGTSWSNASGRTQIQARIDEVAVATNQGTVYFAAGTYLIGAQIQLKNNVQMMGGYAADGSGTRDLLNNQTILDGQFNKRIIFTGDQSPNVAFTKITKLDGFVLQRGSSSYGSAAAISIGTVLENCIIRNNNGSTQGAAVFIKRHATISSPTVGWNMASALINCVIVNNTSSNLAAAIFTNDDSHFNVINCTIANNKSTDATGGVGGLLFAKNIRYARVANNIFYNNYSPVSGRNNFYHTGTDALAAIFNNYFSDSSLPNTNITAGNGNKLSTDVANPGFAAATSFQGYDATKMSEIASADWRLTSASGLIGFGSTVSGRADITYPYSSPYFNNVARAFTTVTTDVQGSSRIINTTVEMGAYEYNPITSTVSSSNNDHGTVNANQEVSKGSNITQTATPSYGYHFVNWTESGSEVSTNATYTFTASTNRTLVANFEPNTVPVSSGTINASSITCTTCDVTVASGAELTVGATKELKSVTVAAGGKLTITAGALNATNGITLESTADGTATLVDAYETPTVNATVKQYVTAGRNWYMSAPLNNTANVSDLNKGNSVQQYNEATGLWEIIASGTLTRGRGYIQVANATQGATGTVQFEGIVNSGDVPVTLTNNTAGRGFNLVGNPYPSYLNWSLVAADPVNTNLTTGAEMPNGTAWYRTIDYNGKSAWATGVVYAANAVVYNGASFYKTLTGGTSGATAPTGTGTNISDGSVIWQNEGSVYIFATLSSNGTPSHASVSNLIPPMQAFWVKSNGGTLTFKNSMRAHESVSNKLKAPKSQLSTMPFVRLSVSNGASADQVAIYASDNASNAFDSADAPKFFNNSGSYQAEIYTLAGNEKLAINALNNITEETTLALGFVTEKENRYSLKATEIANLPANLQLILRDKQTNTEFNLSESEAYQFGSSATNNADRFSLIFRAKGTTTGFDNKNQSEAIVYTNAAGQIVISAPEKSNYAIYNAVGQLIAEGAINHLPFTINHSKGVFVVKVNNQSTRVIIK